MSDKPSLLQIGGRIIQRVLKTSNEFTIDIIDGLVRMYQNMDDEMYEKWSEKRWRHYLQTDFAVRCLATDIPTIFLLMKAIVKKDYLSM